MKLMIISIDIIPIVRGRRDKYLDKDGNPTGKNSEASHLTHLRAQVGSKWRKITYENQQIYLLFS